MNLRRTLWSAATVLLLGATPVMLPTHAALAQASGGSDDSDREAAEAAQKAQAKADAKAAAPPAAIPGAVTDEATETSGHVSADMEPTAALFDAINRGDMTSAKEALGRGADLAGRNVLGQSPLDMSIDLNRNDITFLLLSMRNSEQGPPVASVAAVEPIADHPAGVRRGRAARSRATRLVSVRQSAGGPRGGDASDGGVARPDIGFLGFGGS